MKIRRMLGGTLLSFGMAATAWAAEGILPKHKLPPSTEKNLVVGLCDGETSLEVKGKKPGDGLNPVEARQVSNQLMAAWQKKHPGSDWSKEEAVWRASTQAAIDRGNKVFHDAKLLGGTIAVSCDMCHPNAANTHPETYPKYQV